MPVARQGRQARLAGRRLDSTVASHLDAPHLGGNATRHQRVNRPLRHLDRPRLQAVVDDDTQHLGAGPG